MKTLIEYLNINESKKEFALCWSHSEPETMYVVEDADYDGLDELLSNYDWNYDWCDTGKLCIIGWSDESASHWDTGCNSFSQIKNQLLKTFQKAIAEKEDEDYLFVKDSVFGGEYEYYDEEACLSAKEYVDNILNDIENSYVDGDSGWAQSIIDIDKKKVVHGNQDVVFMSYSGFKYMLQ